MSCIQGSQHAIKDRDEVIINYLISIHYRLVLPIWDCGGEHFQKSYSAAFFKYHSIEIINI